MKHNIYLASKPRYEILDGLRGVAAMLVVCYHLLETYYHGGTDQPINHGYLAVDFFFVLSGFVIGYAYDDRWNQMSMCVGIRETPAHPPAPDGDIRFALRSRPVLFRPLLQFPAHRKHALV